MRSCASPIGSRGRYGAVIDPLRLLLTIASRCSATARAAEIASERADRVDARLKHLAEMRAGMICGCEWCPTSVRRSAPGRGCTETTCAPCPPMRPMITSASWRSWCSTTRPGFPRSPVDVPAELDRLREHLDEALRRADQHHRAREPSRPFDPGRSGSAARDFPRAPSASPEARWEVLAARSWSHAGAMSRSAGHLVLYDAECRFCCWSLAWLLRWDRARGSSRWRRRRTSVQACSPGCRRPNDGVLALSGPTARSARRARLRRR